NHAGATGIRQPGARHTPYLLIRKHVVAGSLARWQVYHYVGGFGPASELGVPLGLPPDRPGVQLIPLVVGNRTSQDEITPRRDILERKSSIGTNPCLGVPQSVLARFLFRGHHHHAEPGREAILNVSRDDLSSKPGRAFGQRHGQVVQLLSLSDPEAAGRVKRRLAR